MIPRASDGCAGLLRGFANRGGTVLLSSHLIHEIEVIADELVVIGSGKIVAHGSKESMLTAAGTFVRGLDAVALRTALESAGLTYVAEPNGAFVVEASTEQVGKAALAGGVVLTELQERGLRPRRHVPAADGSRCPRRGALMR